VASLKNEDWPVSWYADQAAAMASCTVAAGIPKATIVSALRIAAANARKKFACTDVERDHRTPDRVSPAVGAGVAANAVANNVLDVTAAGQNGAEADDRQKAALQPSESREVLPFLPLFTLGADGMVGGAGGAGVYHCVPLQLVVQMPVQYPKPCAVTPSCCKPYDWTDVRVKLHTIDCPGPRMLVGQTM